ncbi:hypothetical protein [Streptomyces sp. NPDC058614]|uniref:hypothetical protein n=1 Tax=Streptomyces sp. NPDC058614 TaxID=3346557 RepID=UPI0036587E4C
MLIPAYLLRHEVTVEAYEGDSAYGEVYGAPAIVRCFLEQKTRVVRDRKGRQVTSSSTFYCRLDEATAPPESQVTLPDGTKTTVIEAVPHGGGGLPTPDHLEVQLV